MMLSTAFQSTLSTGHTLVALINTNTSGAEKVNVPSFLCRANDSIDVKEKSKKVTRILESLGAVDRRGVPKWLELDKDNFKGKLTSLPARDDLTLPIREQLIVELYSR